MLAIVAVDERDKVVVVELLDRLVAGVRRSLALATLVYDIADWSGASRARRQPFREGVKSLGAFVDLLTQPSVEFGGQICQLPAQIAFQPPALQ